MSIKVLLADDHKILRESLRALLEREPDIAVVAEARTGLEAVKATRKARPDVAVMDVRMPEISGIEATRQICQEMPQVKVLGLSMHTETRELSEMLAAGARGYLSKHTASEELVLAIRTLASKGYYLSPSLAGKAAVSIINEKGAEQESAFAALSPREREVLQLLAEGHSARETATRLHLSVKTVHSHREHIRDKLDLHSQAELTKYAIREGLTSVDD